MKVLYLCLSICSCRTHIENITETLYVALDQGPAAYENAWMIMPDLRNAIATTQIKRESSKKRSHKYPRPYTFRHESLLKLLFTVCTHFLYDTKYIKLYAHRLNT